MSDRAAWESRANEGLDPLNQVLFRRWPPALNQLLHDWHVTLLDRALRDLPAEGVRVLDVGCGPGRLGGELARRCQVAAIVGVDHAPTFLDAFRAATAPKGTAVEADLRPDSIPGGEFHLAVVAGTLMYVPPPLQAEVLSRILSRLRPEGRLLLVENDSAGLRAATWWGLLAPGSRGRTGDYVFRPGELRSLIERANGHVRWSAGVPLATILLPVLWGTAKLAPGVASRLGALWSAASGWPGPSFQTALCAAPTGGAP